MSQHSHLDSVQILNKRAYPLPQVHSSIGHNVERRSGSKRKLVLGVNQRTGRLQWCPGMTCCKFLIILPVVMLPLMLVLILLMRMDGMLMALRLQEQQQQQQQLQQQHQQQQQEQRLQEQPTYIDYYDTNGGDAIEDIVSEQLLMPLDRQELIEVDRMKRCISFQFGLSETIEVEERDIMKDARTSFLPPDTAAIPRECLETMSYGTSPFSRRNDFPRTEEFLRKRARRTSGDVTQNSYYEADNATSFDDDANDPEAEPDGGGNGNGDGDGGVGEVAAEKETDYFETASSANSNEFEAKLIDSMSSLQSIWNDQGTKESIRQAQAQTMLKYMDTNVDPCNDFYKYACGNWERLHPIPKDKAGFDTFEMLRENLDVVLKQLLETNDGDAAAHPNTEKNKLVLIEDNTFEQNGDTKADIVGSAAAPTSKVAVAVVPEAAVAARETEPDAAPAAAETSKTEQEQLKAKTARLRRHIVKRRDTLSRILNRYRRQTSNTKRKRLISFRNGYIRTFGFANRKPAYAPPIAPTNDAQLKAKYLYQSCTNSRLLAKRGTRPLLRLIESLGGWPVLDPNWNGNGFNWLNLTAQLRRYNNDILLVEWVGPDIKNSDENVIQFDQTSLGLPTREYFLQPINSKYLQAYQLFMTEVMHNLGAPNNVAQTTAAELIAFETRLARITSPAEQRLNVTKLYKRMTLRQLHNEVPEIDWLRYLSILQERNVQDSEQVVIYAVDYMQELVNLLADTNRRTVANYLLWRFVRHRINNVDDRFEESKQSFYHTLFGREESPSRWKVCIAQVNTNMGMALGSMFVRKYFDENSKRDTLKMTHELQQAFREILTTTDWLDPSTKHLAELKVNAMSLKIGYPDFILNTEELNEKYAGIEIHPDMYFENTLNVLMHTSKMDQNKLHEPVNKTTWQTAPAIVNAYYSRNKNQIMFPAGILQPPFYHRHFPRSLNFGGIGVVIGHELTHGFDDKGRLFDRNGSIHKWWTDASIKGFDERARCIIAQYGNYTVGEVGITLNGESTQGENIADNGGIRQAFHAYKRWLKDNPNARDDERMPGINMSGEQLFFLNFGQVWCGAMRPEAVRNKLNTAIHSPGRFRVIGTVSNSNDFAREFQCPVGSPMNPEHKCSVW